MARLVGVEKATWHYLENRTQTASAEVRVIALLLQLGLLTDQEALDWLRTAWKGHGHIKAKRLR
jgi:hypothetical protein